MNSNILKKINGLMLLKKNEYHYIFINDLLRPDLKYTKNDSISLFFLRN